MKYLKYLSIVLLAVFMAWLRTCKAKPLCKEEEEITCKPVHLGRNKYFFSPEYQKKVEKEL